MMLTSRLGVAGAVLVSVAVLLAAAALFAWLAVSQLNLLVNGAVATARSERDAQWKSQIAEANRKAAEAQTAQIRHAQQVDEQARLVVENAQKKLTELENANAALPDDGGGIRRDRVRLLNQH